jgi:mutator protein MutT
VKSAEISSHGFGKIKDRFRGGVTIPLMPPGGLMASLWEFPGGKVKGKESPEACLRRELLEELGVQVALIEKLAVIRHAYTQFRVCVSTPTVANWILLAKKSSLARLWKASGFLWVNWIILPSRRPIEGLSTSYEMMLAGEQIKPQNIH